MGQYEQAIQDFDESIRIDPTYAYAYSSRGMSRYYLGQYEQAIQHFDDKPEAFSPFNCSTYQLDTT
jgi:tetratricopeptide (TPR) repeat protein